MQQHPDIDKCSLLQKNQMLKLLQNLSIGAPCTNCRQTPTTSRAYHCCSCIATTRLPCSMQQRWPCTHHNPRLAHLPRSLPPSIPLMVALVSLRPGPWLLRQQPSNSRHTMTGAKALQPCICHRAYASVTATPKNTPASIASLVQGYPRHVSQILLLRMTITSGLTQHVLASRITEQTLQNT